MELVKNIFFNTDKLIENSKVKISYTGQFFQDGSKDVFIHFGFGYNWDNVKDIKMEKTELGFQTEIELDSNDSLNLCFYNENNKYYKSQNRNNIKTVRSVLSPYCYNNYKSHSIMLFSSHNTL